MAIRGEINISDQLESILEEYAEKINDTMEFECKRIGYETANDLKATSPRSDRAHKHYADGWRAKKDGKFGYVVYNSTHWQLTHLLNNRHVVANANGTYGVREGDNHIGKAEERAIRKFIDEVEKRL